MLIYRILFHLLLQFQQSSETFSTKSKLYISRQIYHSVAIMKAIHCYRSNFTILCKRINWNECNKTPCQNWKLYYIDLTGSDSYIPVFCINSMLGALISECENSYWWISFHNIFFIDFSIFDFRSFRSIYLLPLTWKPIRNQFLWLKVHFFLHSFHFATLLTVRKYLADIYPPVRNNKILDISQRWMWNQYLW